MSRNISPCNILFLDFFIFCGIFSIEISTDLDDGGEVLSVDVVLCLHVKVTQLAGSHWVVLCIELVETLEGLSALHRSTKRTETVLSEVKTLQRSYA